MPRRGTGGRHIIPLRRKGTTLEVLPKGHLLGQMTDLLFYVFNKQYRHAGGSKSRDLKHIVAKNRHSKGEAEPILSRILPLIARLNTPKKEYFDTLI